jgi:nitronate monooxygenase
MTIRLDNPFLSKLRMTTPIIQAPMTGYVTEEMVVAVSNAGGLGTLPGTLLSPQAIIESMATLRKRTTGPIAMNFLAHPAVVPDPDRHAIWRGRLAPFFDELGLDQGKPSPGMPVPVFGDVQCKALEQARPDVVSFHLGLPDDQFVARLKTIGAMIISSATTVAEAAGWKSAVVMQSSRRDSRRVGIADRSYQLIWLSNAGR